MGIDISHRVYTTSGELDRSRTLPSISIYEVSESEDEE